MFGKVAISYKDAVTCRPSLYCITGTRWIDLRSLYSYAEKCVSKMHSCNLK